MKPQDKIDKNSQNETLTKKNSNLESTNKISVFLNSNLGIFILSTFFISFLSWAYTTYSSYLKEKSEKSNQTEKLEAEIRQVMDDYWDSYLKGDLKTWASYLPDGYRNIGTTQEEIWNSKLDIVEYTNNVIDQMVGVASQGRRVSSFTLLLAGITINTTCIALILFLQNVTTLGRSLSITRWLMGGIDALDYGTLALLAVPMEYFAPGESRTCAMTDDCKLVLASGVTVSVFEIVPTGSVIERAMAT